MSLGRPVVPVNPNDYQRNNAQFDQMQQLLNEMRTANDEGFLEYERRERELQQRMEAGEQARREQQRQQMLVEDAERASRELAQLQAMRNQLLITNGNSGGVAPQPLASSSARIEELPSPPNRVATTNNSSRHHHVQQIPSNHNQRPHLQNNPYLYAQQATYPQYPTMSQYQPNTSSSSFQNQARTTGSSVYGWSQNPISYNAPSSYLPRNNQAPNLNTMPAAGTSSINGVPEARATPQPSVSSSNTHSGVLGDLSRVTGPGPFNEQQRLEIFAESVNTWAKNVQDHAEVYLEQLQLWLVKGSPSQNARSVSVKVRDPSGEMRAATREELVLRIRRAYDGYNTRSQPDIQSVHTHRSAPQDVALAQTAQIPSISHSSATPSSRLYTSTSLPPQTLASRPSPVQASLRNMSNNLPPVSTPSSSTTIGSPSTSLLRTPAQADKSTLARNILRGLGGPKRPRSNDEEDLNGRDPKRQAVSNGKGPINSVHQTPHSSNQTQTATQATFQQAETVQQAHSIPQPVPQQQLVPPQTQPITKTPEKAKKPESSVGAGSDTGPVSLAQKEAPKTKGAGTATPDAEELTSPPPAPTLDLVHPISSPSPPSAVIEPSTPPIQRGPGAGSQPGSSKRPESFIVEETPPPSPLQQPGTPLFLASPAPSSSSVVILDGPPSPKSPTRANLKKNGEKDTGKRRTVLRLQCVELPPAPAWVKRDLELPKEKQRKGKEREQVPVHRSSHRKIVISDSEEDLLANDNAAKRSLAARVQEAYSSQAQTPGKDPEELEIMNLAKSRLKSLSCKWQSCDAVMNSVARLEHHLVDHVKDMVRQKPYTCQWQACRHQESRRGRLAAHVVSHVLPSLPCPYEECKESFQHVHRLLQHSRRHHSNSRTRPSAEPFAPTLSSPPECPDYLPSYMVITRQIVPRSIPRERHVANGPRVLQNIMPPTSWKRGTLSPSNLKRRGPKSPAAEDEYEFITYRASASYRPSTSAKVDKLGNLPSTLVSELVGGGLTLWKDGVRVALGDEKRVMESEIKEAPATEITPVQ